MSHGPVGGGEFIARKGTAVDDGGYICVPTGQTEYYWQRIPKTPGKFARRSSAFMMVRRWMA